MPSSASCFEALSQTKLSTFHNFYLFSGSLCNLCHSCLYPTLFILLAYQEEQHAKRREKLLKGNQKNAVELADDPIHNDFKREMLFYRQAQATVLSALEIFRAKKIPTKRPEDYFAQMFKTDEHMQKIRTKLAQKQDEEDRISKVRKLRELKKIGKKVQVEKLQKR